MMTVDRIIDEIVEIEGEYTNHPADRGGPTRWGITEKVARAWGYDGDMRDLPQSIARDIYRQKYYIEPGFERVAKISNKIAVEMTDTGVNMGQSRAVRFLQRGLNALNRDRKLYPDVAVDGVLGRKSLSALKAFLKARGSEGELVLLRSLNALQTVRYIEIVEADHKQEEFYFGWVLKRVEI